jgi:hypothetical protein
MKALTQHFTAAATVGAVLATANLGHADHGPGTSGGGAATQSGETLKPGKFALELRTDYTEFEHLSSAQIAAKAARAGEFDLLDRSFVSTIGLSYGVMENFQVGLTLGYYNAVHARSAEYDAGTGDTEINTFNPDGLTDLWLTGKYRFYRGPQGNLAVFGGVKFPTGRDDVKNSAGERLEPSATAGSGSYDGMLGLAHSRFLTARLTFDASAQYTLRSEANDFNLNKVAQLQGVEVLNINELANSLKPVVLPGEIMKVFILKEGKEYNQGVAYLDDVLIYTDGTHEEHVQHVHQILQCLLDVHTRNLFSPV